MFGRKDIKALPIILYPFMFRFRSKCTIHALKPFLVDFCSILDGYVHCIFIVTLALALACRSFQRAENKTKHEQHAQKIKHETEKKNST